MAEYSLEMLNIHKSFPGVKALNGAQLKVRAGTVHSLMGENGAGKSTLMKCLFGVYKMDEGSVKLFGEPVQIQNPNDALQKGVAMVHQELQPILDRSIAENIFCGRYPIKNIFGLKVIDHKTMFDESARILKSIGMNFDPKMLLKDLTVSQMQIVEIAKAISVNAKIIIMDEPTSSLTSSEVKILFEIIENLRRQGVSFIYISHKMEEILKISDEVTIMRDGNYIGTWSARDIDTNFIITKMVGREIKDLFPPHENMSTDEIVLKVEDFTSINPNSFKDVSFELKKGEILGLGGLVGAQRTELMEGIFGIRSSSKGKIYFKGKEISINRPRDAIQAGIALLTEDRRATGIFGVLSISENVGISSLDNYLKRSGLLDVKAVDALAEDNISKLSIKTPSTKTKIQNLSGGNQQKVIISRWLANDPDVFILDEPTRGIDVGAKYEIYMIMLDLIKRGKSIIMISSEMPELLGMSDRILVMCEGRVSGCLDAKEASQEKIMELATKFM